MLRRNPGKFLLLIVILALLAGAFVYPKGYGAKWQPWHLGLDLVGGSHLIYKIDLSAVSSGNRDSVVAGLRDVIERRVNLFGVAEPQVYIAQSGNSAELNVDLAGVSNIKDAISQIGETPLLDFVEIMGEGSSTEFVPTNLTGQYLVSSQLSFDAQTNRPQIDFTLNDQGAGIFQRMTKKNAGKPLCVFVDGAPIIPSSIRDSCPTVSASNPDGIAGGRAQITGSFTVAEAQQIVEHFNAGALPAPITLINQETVSPTLGVDSLRSVAYAGVIGTILVMLFMILYYRLFGVFASLALLIYVVLTLGVFKIIPITMTLSGIAGFVLTIGMAVDANILTFERIKEELARGLTKKAAIEEGFRRAWPSIRDSNTSTLLTAIILYFFTSSFVQGFAVALLIGVAMSLFSAITTTRLILRVFTKESQK